MGCCKSDTLPLVVSVDILIYRVPRFVVLLLCFISFIAFSTFPGWHEEIDADGEEKEVRPFPGGFISRFSLIVSSSAVWFAFVSVFWQHINSSSTATMAEVLNYGAVSGHVGTTAMALGWISVGAIIVVSLAVWLMILSIKILQRLTEDESSHCGDSSSEGSS
jgi:hypothetical protein